MVHPQTARYFLIFCWLMFGLLASVSVFMRAGGSENLRHHKAARNIFFLLICLAGPLNLFIALIPIEIVRAWKDAGRAWLDAREARPPQLSYWQKRRIIRAQRKYLKAQKEFNRKVAEATLAAKEFGDAMTDAELRKIGGERE
jgi:hypothetical protein